MLCIYKKATAKLSSVRSITAIGLVGKHRLLNANFFGMFRYTMFSLLPEELITKYILSDAKKFLWKRDPELSADELGSTGTIGKWISMIATFRPIKKGGVRRQKNGHV